MKKSAVSKMLFSVVLFVLVFWIGGCSEGWKGYTQKPGETAAEGHRRHLRNLSINQQEMVSDIDRVILADEPSTATKERIP